MHKDKPEPMPITIEDWRLFMNGYRDPKTLEELRKEYDFDEGGYAYRLFLGGGDGSGSRECGDRKEGGTYATCPLSPNGKPLEHFVVCQPVPVVKDDYNLANVGVKLVDIEEPCLKCGGVKPKKTVKAKYFEVCPECNGTGTETVTHVFDIVGQEYYPNVADFLEEARRMGVSRRLELEDRKQYARLSSRSRLMLLHHRAVINNGGKRIREMMLRELQRIERAGCPKDLHKIAMPTGDARMRPACSALYWHVIEQGEEIGEDYFFVRGGQAPANDVPPKMPSNGFVERRLASGSYRGYALPEGFKPEYGLGIFAVFPLVKIDVVDPDGSYADRVERAGAARLDVEAVEC